MIKPKKIRSLKTFRPTIFSKGYYGSFARVRGPYKDERNPSPYAPFIPGMQIQDSTELNISNQIKESAIETIRKKARHEVNKYMKTPDGVELKSSVRDLIRNKISDRKKKI
jgi:hypothetical protein